MWEGDWGLMWCRNQASEPINWQPLEMGGGTTFQIWPFLAFYWTWLVYIFWKTEGCSVGDWGLIWCQTQAFEPICNCQLPEMGRGIPFWEPEYEILFEAKGTSPWNQNSKISKIGGIKIHQITLMYLNIPQSTPDFMEKTSNYLKVPQSTLK